MNWPQSPPPSNFQRVNNTGTFFNNLLSKAIGRLDIAIADDRETNQRTTTMRMRTFSQINLSRCEASNGFNHPLQSWTASDWFTATMGELGEAANVAKKLNRVRDGITGNKETPDELREKLAGELADTFIYLDLLAQSQGINLEDAVVNTFNKKSQEIGYDDLIF